MDPSAVGGGNESLGPEYHAAALSGREGLKRRSDLLLGVFSRSLGAPAREDLVGVVMVVVMALALGIVALPVAVMVVVMVMLMLLMFILIIVIVVMVVVMLMLLMFIFTVVVIVIMMVVMVMLMLLMLIFIVVVIVVVVMMMVMVVVLLVIILILFVSLGEALQLGLEGVLPLHRLKDRLPVKQRPVGGDEHGSGVVLPDEGDGLGELRV